MAMNRKAFIGAKISPEQKQALERLSDKRVCHVADLIRGAISDLLSNNEGIITERQKVS